MRFNTIALTLATAGSLVTAQHHHQHRRHQHKRENVVETGTTVVQYELDGKPISLQEVCAGLSDGTLKFADNDHPTGVCDNLSSSATPTSMPEVAPTFAPAKFIELSSLVTPVSPTSDAVPTPTASSSSSTAAGLDADFPDGELDCSTFPSQYGAVPLDYLGLHGWSGIQYVSYADKVISEIVTAITGESCTSGAMCSYACPAGYQKSQWPSTQGSAGQSVGGIECRNGKLYLTNPKSKKLCIPGVGGVYVQNTVGEVVSVCRTDYPGTESETIPLGLGDNELQPLTCPDETYYKWQGQITSAQYYVNPKGVSPEKGCQWGDGTKPIGNWAPVNLGVGQNKGKWLSIFQNSPTTNEKLDFNIKIKGDHLSGSCKYENGVFCSDTGISNSGCTVEVMSGDATFVFY
ncbi:secreted beta-glucosidase sun1 [Aspergillus viridinutans]|uniref:Secreted beta-glucosidase sun1 n=1 Tax=Aspergillus viridinutans TaxID=75553 RepID=A0A9P3F705_ASPVI|nr:secreted beta-glucosidase sun1 [Aspergillus viridinutans]GIK03955.1 secreted beta-glucosidase sun1 [Aspergillus viridinutans]